MREARHAHIDTVLKACADAVAGDQAAFVKKSWARSASTFGIDPASDRPPELLTEREIVAAQEPARALLNVAGPELDRLYKMLRLARYVVLLCDADGTVIDHRGEDAEADHFKYWGVWRGGVWSESREGTNGIGTAICEQRPVTVHRAQHFRARHMTLSCSGAPFYDANGKLAGILDVSSIDPQLSEHAHALTGPLTQSFAQSIEERLFRDRFRKSWVLAIQVPHEVQCSMLLAVDDRGLIAGANALGRGVLASLGHTLENGLSFDAVFAPNDRLFRRRSEDLIDRVNVHDTEDSWIAVVTSPEVALTARLHPDLGDLHVRPRLDRLLPSERAHPAPLRGGLSAQALQRVRDYVDANLAQPLTLELLAGEAALSTAHFARAFKQSQGMTPHDYLVQRRIARAKELLRRRDVPLSQIATLTGFSDQSHLSRRFREIVGVSPGRYRTSL